MFCVPEPQVSHLRKNPKKGTITYLWNLSCQVRRKMCHIVRASEDGFFTILQHQVAYFWVVACKGGD
jgi:hypothetical protein